MMEGKCNLNRKQLVPMVLPYQAHAAITTIFILHQSNKQLYFKCTELVDDSW